MATLRIDDDNLVLELTTAEKVMGLHGDVTVPLAAFGVVREVPSVRAELRGIRAPGYSLFGRKVGTWRARGGKDFVAITSYGEGTVIELNGHDFERLIVSCAVPAQLHAAV